MTSPDFEVAFLEKGLPIIENYCGQLFSLSELLDTQTILEEPAEHLLAYQ